MAGVARVGADAPKEAAAPSSSAGGRRRAIRLCLIAPSLAPAGGLARYSRELVRGLEALTSPDELEVHVLVRGRMDFARSTAEEYGLRCTLHELHTESSSTAERLRSARNVSALVRSLHADVLHVPVGSIWLLAPLLLPARRRPPALVVVAHGEATARSIPSHERRMIRRLATRSGVALLANTPLLGARLDDELGLPDGTSRAVRVGVDPLPVRDAETDRDLLRRAFEIEDDEYVVVVLSRLVSGKRVELVPEIAAAVRRTGCRVRFIVCGDGPTHSEVRAAVGRYGVEREVRLVGHVSDPGSFLLGADALLHPSDSEGAPFAVIEALTAGTPVVAARVGGIPDLVAVPRDGELVPAGDVGAMAAAVMHVLDQPGSRDQRAFEAGRRFSLEGMAWDHLHLLRDLVGGPSTRPPRRNEDGS